MYTGVMLAFALALVCLNGFFVAAEFSFVKVRKTQLELLAENGSSRARSALFGVARLDAYLSVCQLGITLASLGLGWIGEPAVADVLRPLLTAFAVTSPALQTSICVAVGFAIITFLHVVFGELVPKSLSIQKAERVALLLAKPMRLFYALCLPLVLVMNGLSNAFLRLLGIGAASENEQAHSPEELRMLIVDSSKDGQIDEDEGRMLDNIFSFYQKTAKDIMLHRLDVISFDISSSPDDLLDEARKSGHTRYPVYEGDRDNVVGFVHIRDIVQREKADDLAAIARAPMWAHETLPLNKLLSRMRNKRHQLAVVIDEYGIWQGIVTMEDIVETIVGSIQDEFDNEEPDAVREPGGSWLIAGDLSLDELAEHLPLSCRGKDIDPYKIIAAHFIDRLGRIPREGDAMDLCGKRFSIVAMDRNTVRRVRVSE